MSTIKTRDISKSLEAKGFKKQETHHEMYWLHVDGKKTSVRTRISHGSTEYDGYLLGQVAKEMGLRRSELNNFVECCLSATDYVKLLSERKLIRL